MTAAARWLWRHRLAVLLVLVTLLSVLAWWLWNRAEALAAAAAAGAEAARRYRGRTADELETGAGERDARAELRDQAREEETAVPAPSFDQVVAEVLPVEVVDSSGRHSGPDSGPLSPADAALAGALRRGRERGQDG